MESSFAVNKYLHTVASVGFLFTLNYGARNHDIINILSVIGTYLKVHNLHIRNREHSIFTLE